MLIANKKPGANSIPFRNDNDWTMIISNLRTDKDRMLESIRITAGDQRDIDLWDNESELYGSIKFD